MVHVDIFEGVPGVLALLCAVEHQSHQIPVTADDLTGVDTAHDLRNTNIIILKRCHHTDMKSVTDPCYPMLTCMVMSKFDGSPSSPLMNISLEASTRNTKLSLPVVL